MSLTCTSNILTTCTDKNLESKLYLELVHPIIKYLSFLVYDLHLLIKGFCNNFPLFSEGIMKKF